MAAKRRARRPRSHDSEEMEEDSGMSGEVCSVMRAPAAETIVAHKPPLPEDAGAQVSPARNAPRDEVMYPPRKASKAAKTRKRVRKALWHSQEERAQDGTGEFDEASPVINATAEETPAASPARRVVASPNHKETGAMPNRGKKRRAQPPQEGEHEDKLVAGAGADATGEPPAETAAALSQQGNDGQRDKERRKKRKRKKLGKALTEPPQPESAELGLDRNRVEAPGVGNTSPPLEEDMAREADELDREMAAQELPSNTEPHEKNNNAHEEEEQGEEAKDQGHARNTSPPHEKDRAHEEEEQGEETTDHEHVGNTSHPKDTTREDEQHGEETAEQANEDDEQGEEIAGQDHNINTSLQHDNHSTYENGEMLIASPPKLCFYKGQKKPALERSWSQEDEFKILTALFKHAQAHNGALPESSHLMANLTFDKTDANEDKLNDKIRKLRVRYRKLCSQGCPTDNLGHHLFELSKGIWGQVNEDERAERTSLTREFSELSRLYPYLANEVKVYAKTHSSGDLIMAAFKTIGDRKARHLDARCKKQRIDAFKLELSQADLTNEMLSAFSSQIN